MNKRFENKVFVITGAAGGIGKAVAIMAAKEGAKLLLTDINEKKSLSALDEIKNLTNDVEFVIGNIADPINAKKVIDRAIEKYNVIDVVANVAGITSMVAPIHLSDVENFKNVFECNVLSVFNICHYALAEIIKDNRGGAIVNVSSIAGLTGSASQPAYVSSKHAVVGLTKNMALDYVKYGVRVNAVAPGATYTPMLESISEYVKARKVEGSNEVVQTMGYKTVAPMNRVAMADEIANAILFLASDAASYMTGVVMPVDGGYTCY